jgi:hypothetical protein
MPPPSKEGRPSSEPPALLRPCRSCGRPPSAAIQVGRGWSHGWFSCPDCGVRTRDGLTYAEAWREWNAVFAEPERPV